MTDRRLATVLFTDIVGTTERAPEDAEMIDYGMALVGDGHAWIDAVSIEVDTLR